jgi:hypothetical protein
MLQHASCCVDPLILESHRRSVSAPMTRGLQETNVLVVSCLPGWAHVAAVLRVVAQRGFRLVALRLVWLTLPQARALSARLFPDRIDVCRFNELVHGSVWYLRSCIFISGII